MLLENKYFTLTGIDRQDEHRVTCHVELCPDCNVYQGHFPGHPVCPGACNIQMIKELVGKVTQAAWLLTSIASCRLTAVATPDGCGPLAVEMTIDRPEAGRCLVTATVADENKTYVEFKGEFKS